MINDLSEPYLALRTCSFLILTAQLTQNLYQYLVDLAELMDENVLCGTLLRGAQNRLVLHSERVFFRMFRAVFFHFNMITSRIGQF